MNKWSKNLKLTGGVAAVAVLAGVGVLVWALGFRGSTDNAAQKQGLASPKLRQQAFTFDVKGANTATPSGVGGISQLGASDVTFDLAAESRVDVIAAISGG